MDYVTSGITRGENLYQNQSVNISLGFVQLKAC